MPVYVVTGTSKGIGFELLRQISENPEDIVIGLVRDTVTTKKKVSAEFGDRSNVHILHADLTDHASLKKAAVDAESIVGTRGIDYLIANGAFPSQFDAYGPIGALSDKVDELEEVCSRLSRTNVVGNIHLFNLFLPLVKKGKARKVIAISSGHADLDFINNLELEHSALYAASKAAMNVIVAKFSAQHKPEGVLFVSISPGAIDVGQYAHATPEQVQGMMSMMSKFAEYAPDFKAPMSVEDGVRNLRGLIERVSISDGYGGTFISHFGNKQWL